MNINIQRAVLATFLWSNDHGMATSDAFELNPHLFTRDRYLIASRVNEITLTNDRYYGLLLLELENTSPTEWLELSLQTPLSFSVAKRYYNELEDPRMDMI